MENKKSDCHWVDFYETLSRFDDISCRTAAHIFMKILKVFSRWSYGKDGQTDGQKLSPYIAFLSHCQ
jgi:hypothetical protein